MNKNYKRMTHKDFLKCIDKLCRNLEKYLKDNEIKVDYICPVMRSGAVPAVYISNRLNIVKFLPIQVKHVTYKNGDNKIDLIFNPFNSIELEKESPVFLIVEGLHCTGTSVKICIDEIKNRYKNARILYVCLTKEYGSCDFREMTIYEDFVFYYNGTNKFDEEKCRNLGIEFLQPLFPWEILEMELNHPDDLEQNIFF